MRRDLADFESVYGVSIAALDADPSLRSLHEDASIQLDFLRIEEANLLRFDSQLCVQEEIKRPDMEGKG